MTTNDLTITATLLVGNKVYYLAGTINRESWEQWDTVQRADARMALKQNLASTIGPDDLIDQMQVGDATEESSPVGTYKLYAGEE